MDHRSESEFPWEKAALSYLREQLPDAEPFRAWSNFEFIAEDGSINEVDLLVVSLYRLFLVEIKSRPGRVAGDTATWTWSGGELPETTTDNPLLLANRKAKKLKDLLRRQKSLNKQRVPYVAPIIFLSHQNLRCDLSGAARTGVYPRSEAKSNAPGVIEVLSGQLDQSASSAFMGDRIDGRLSNAIGRAMSDAGIRPAQRHRQVGDYTLGQLLVETDVYQDWEAACETGPGRRG